MSDGETRSTAEIKETDDGFEVLPPTLSVVGEPPQAVRDAVEAALEAEPNACDGPALSVRADLDYAAAEFTAHYNGLYVSTGDGPEDYEVLPPYRSRERFDAALTDALGDAWSIEHEDGGATTFYRD